MKILQFKCKLISDIVLSQNTATEGSQKTLDFIPGSSFLGLVASQLYNQVPPKLPTGYSSITKTVPFTKGQKTQIVVINNLKGTHDR